MIFTSFLSTLCNKLDKFVHLVLLVLVNTPANFFCLNQIHKLTDLFLLNFSQSKQTQQQQQHQPVRRQRVTTVAVEPQDFLDRLLDLRMNPVQKVQAVAKVVLAVERATETMDARSADNTHPSSSWIIRTCLRCNSR